VFDVLVVVALPKVSPFAMLVVLTGAVVVTLTLPNCSVAPMPVAAITATTAMFPRAVSVGIEDPETTGAMVAEPNNSEDWTALDAVAAEAVTVGLPGLSVDVSAVGEIVAPEVAMETTGLPKVSLAAIRVGAMVAAAVVVALPKVCAEVIAAEVVATVEVAVALPNTSEELVLAVTTASVGGMTWTSIARSVQVCPAGAVRPSV